MNPKCPSVVVAACAALFVSAAPAWACVTGPDVQLSTSIVKAGDTVQLRGSGFTRTDPVQFRFDAVDGPVLADLGVPKNGNLEGSVTIPAAIAPGTHVLVFTQTKGDGTFSQLPVRTAITVTSANGALPVVGASESTTAHSRIDKLVTSQKSMSRSALVLIAMGVGGLTVFLGGLVALFSGSSAFGPVGSRAAS